MSTKREHKGNSLIAFSDEFIVVDIETTGLMPYDDIIEVAAVRYKDGAKVDQFQTLVKPHDDYVDSDEFGNQSKEYVSSYITQLTGITNEMLEDAPKFSEIAPDFINFVKKDMLVGYNVNFDINLLYDNLLATQNYLFDNDYIDVMRISRKVYPEFKHHRLKDMVKYYQIDHQDAHRALGDCTATVECYQSLKEAIEEQWASADEFCQKAFMHSKKVKASEIIGDKSLNNPDSPLYGKVCVFTGTLDKYKRADALQIIANLGGIAKDNVTKKTDYLIVGDIEASSNVKGNKTGKQKKAEKYNLQGQDIVILPETAFYEMLEE